MLYEIFRVIGEVVGGFSVSAAKPLFAVTGDENSAEAVRAVAYCVALSGGDVACAADENAARKIVSLTGGDGIFFVKLSGGDLVISFCSENERIPILRKNLSAADFSLSAGDIY